MKKLLFLLAILFLAACSPLSTNSKEAQIQELISEFNKNYNQTDEMPQLKWIKTEGDTIFVKVLNDNYLTQRMGSAGAGEFMKQAVLTLTEMEEIKYVDFNFEEGDHAAPGKYDREDVKDWGI